MRCDDITQGRKLPIPQSTQRPQTCSINPAISQDPIVQMDSDDTANRQEICFAVVTGRQINCRDELAFKVDGSPLHTRRLHQNRRQRLHFVKKPDGRGLESIVWCG